ncbi:MAG: cupin domain-containing protein [Pseudomonadota bacterium]
MKAVFAESAPTYEPQAGWKRVSLCAEEGVSIEWFHKPPLHASPMHEHDNAQVTIVLQGRMVVWTEAGEEADLGPGDAAWFAGGERHAVRNALETESVGVDIFVPGRSFDFWLSRLKQG